MTADNEFTTSFSIAFDATTGSWNTLGPSAPGEIPGARDLWADAGNLSDEALQMLLNSAHLDCFAYLDPIDGVDPSGAAVTDSMRLAEVYQARARFNAVRAAGEGNQVGADGMTVTVFPLDWQVQQLLRPKPGRISIA